MPFEHRSEDFVGVIDALALPSSLFVTTTAIAADKALLYAQRTSINTITSFAGLMLFWPTALIGIIEILERKRRKILNTLGHPFDLYQSGGRIVRSPLVYTELQSHPASIAKASSL